MSFLANISKNIFCVNDGCVFTLVGGPTSFLQDIFRRLNSLDDKAMALRNPKTDASATLRGIFFVFYCLLPAITIHGLHGSFLYDIKYLIHSFVRIFGRHYIASLFKANLL